VIVIILRPLSAPAVKPENLENLKVKTGEFVHRALYNYLARSGLRMDMRVLLVEIITLSFVYIVSLYILNI
jgi:hypothetical protein